MQILENKAAKKQFKKTMAQWDKDFRDYPQGTHVEYQPLFLGLIEKKECFIAIDNSTGDCWVEEFDNKDAAIEWLQDAE